MRFWTWLVRAIGSSDAVAAVAGGIASILFLGLAALIYFGAFSRLGAEVKFMSLAVVGPLLFSAVLGAFVSMMTRIDRLKKNTGSDPWLVFANTFFKPIVAMVMALAVFSAIASGFVGDGIFKSELFVGLADATAAPSGKALYAVWLLGFLSGFSERFASDIVTKIAPPKPGV